MSPLHPTTPYSVSSAAMTPNHVTDDRAAGIAVKVLRISWADRMASDGIINGSYVQQKQAEIQRLRGTGFAIEVDLGLQNASAWVHF